MTLNYICFEIFEDNKLAIVTIASEDPELPKTIRDKILFSDLNNPYDARLDQGRLLRWGDLPPSLRG